MTSWFERYAAKHKPNVNVGGDQDPYMLRWWLIPRNNYFNIYLHKFLRSDSDVALHDHPAWNISILLQGEYTEHTIAAGGVNHAAILKAGDWKFRFAKAAHRIELHAGECWTIFISGPKIRTWGFHCPKGWKPYQDFIDIGGDGKYGNRTGKGCD